VTAAAIEAAGLGRDYGSVRALAALDLVVERGSLVGLLGPNGAGKTTAMLLLATLLAPTRGRAALFGHDTVRERRAARRRLGLVFQEPSVDGLLTVEENLRFAARLAGLGGAAARTAVAGTMARTGLAAHAGRRARTLSGGWRRLLDVARATLHRPDALILDEPTVGLDPEHRERMWALLDAERRERGAAILFSTHYLAEAEPADRVVLLAHGEVVDAGAPAELRAALGEQVAEIEGRGAARLVGALRALPSVRWAFASERRGRVSFTGPREPIVEVIGRTDGVEGVSLRPVTMDDVYFASTQPGAS
jgi:ABC-2 type transport system ATP-binding protein